MEELFTLFEQYQFPKRDVKSSLGVTAIEQYAKIQLPDDYVYYLENYLGVDLFIGVEFIKLWSIEEIINANKAHRIVEQMPNTIGIGTNGSGEFIGIDHCNSEKIQIVLSPLIGLDSKYNTIIGESFTDFLVRLDNRVEWFD